MSRNFSRPLDDEHSPVIDQRFVAIVSKMIILACGVIQKCTADGFRALRFVVRARSTQVARALGDRCRRKLHRCKGQGCPPGLISVISATSEEFNSLGRNCIE
jgi:hypothetical protein